VAVGDGTGWRSGVGSGRRIRPVLWVIFGAAALLVGLGMAVSAAAAATRVGGAGSPPVCRTDFASGCTTERAAVLDSRAYARGSWFTGEQKWRVRVPEGAPRLKDGQLLRLEVPRQDGREALAEGAQVTLIYYGRAPAWIRPASGRVLETGDHPRRSAPMLGWMALFAAFGGIFGIQTGLRSGRREGSWLRRAPAHIVVGLAGVLAIAGMFGALGQTVAGGTIWPGVAGGLIGLGVGALSWRRSHRRESAYLAGP
jgi:hypothetical protein